MTTSSLDEKLERASYGAGNDAGAAASKAKDSLQDMARKAGRNLHDLADTAEQSATDVADAARGKAREKPLQALAIAAGVGFVVGLIFRR